MPLRTLTVQDVLWINLQITRRVNHYSNPRLEEATYYQFGYGDSNGIETQAARLLAGFVRMKPFDAGNEATALATTLTFLELNGRRLTLDDAELCERARAGLTNMEAAKALLSGHLAPDPGDHGGGFVLAHGGGAGLSDVRSTITDVLQRYPTSIGALETTSTSST